MKKSKVRMEDLPIYDITIEEDGNQGIQLVSLVKDPAIEVKGMYFSSEDLAKEQSYEFKAIPEQQIVCGPAMIPNKKILRKNQNGDMYYVKFSEDVITQMVDKFNRENNNKAINVDHTNQMAPAFIRANWQIEDSNYDKSKLYGFNLPKKSWFIEVKIEDKNFWESEVKDANRFSFSIEGLMGQELVEMVEEQLSFDEFIDSLTDEEVLELMSFADEPYNLPPDNPDSTWHTHPNCKCSFSGSTWTSVPSGDGKYPCDTCLNMAKKYRQAQRSGKRSGYNFSNDNIQNISFDFDGTLSEPKVQAIAEDCILNDNNVYIITKRSTTDSKDVYDTAMKLGIKKSNIIFTNGEPKWSYLIDCDIDTHYDDMQDEIEQMKQKTSTKLIKV
jgi:hypothetical protein